MALSEFELIQRYFVGLTAQSPNSDLIVGIGDDCAVVAPDNRSWLAISTDTLVSGVHFPDDISAADIAWKALAVNLSDLAAMGAAPNWFTLALTLPNADAVWLEGFAAGLAQLIQQFPIKLIGGDTSRGPLSITITVAGNVPVGKALLRSGAKIGDFIFVSGYLGEAARGLQLYQQNDNVGDTKKILINRLHRPQPRVLLGKKLLNLANSCIDISDGLLGDLGHICERSGVSACISADKLPLSANLLSCTEKSEAIKMALIGGDDYELCFSVPPEREIEIMQLSDTLCIPITKVGSIVSREGQTKNLVNILNFNASRDLSAFQHFKASE